MAVKTLQRVCLPGLFILLDEPPRLRVAIIYKFLRSLVTFPVKSSFALFLNFRGLVVVLVTRQRFFCL